MCLIPSPTSKDRFRIALQLQTSGEIRSAVDTYKCILCKDPGDVVVLSHMATCLGLLEDHLKALPWFERAWAIARDRAQLATNHATALMALGKISRAAMIASAGLLLQPEQCSHYVNLVKTKTSNEFGDSARSVLRRAVMLEPLRPDLHAWVAELDLKSKHIESATRFILKAILIEPKNSLYHTLLGKVSIQAGADTNATRFFQRSVWLAPLDANARYWLAENFQASNKLEAAQNAFLQAILLAPILVKPMLGLARCLIENGHFHDALRWIQRALLIAPLAARIRSLMSNTLISAGRYHEACAELHRCMVLFPNFPDAYLRLSATEVLLDRPIRAIRWLDWLENLAPSFPGAALCRGDALMHISHFDEAIAAYQMTIEKGFCLPEGYTGKGSGYFNLGRLGEAISCFDQALALRPDAIEALLRRGNCLLSLHRFDEALRDFDAALNFGAISAMLCINRGNTLFSLRRLDEALQSYEQALRIDANRIESYIGIAAVHQKCRRYGDALKAHQGAFRLSHQASIHLGSLIYCSMKSWSRQNLDEYLRDGATRIEAGEDIGNPFPLITAIDDPFFLKKAAQCHGEHFLQCETSSPGSRERSLAHEPRVTIAYFSSDLDTRHPVGVNLEPLLRAHDRERFRLLGFNLSENTLADLLPLFDETHDCFHLSDAEVAALARNRGIDIAIDLNGYTEGARTSIFGLRPAPIQINFLGYPGTMGTTFHDFIVADEQVIPDSALPAYTEQVLRLPHFFMPYDFRASEENQAPRPSRDAYGLPPDAFVFCSFNDFHKITQTMLMSWIHILRETENSVLWLALRGDVSEKGIRKIFESEGIAWSRIIVAHRVKSAEEHHARLSLADLMLDTFPYNSHTTACDAIKSGLPVLTLCGNSFQSRVCSSLLLFLGSHSLIAQDMVEFTEKAVSLARDTKQFAKVKEAYLRGRTKLVQPDAYARSLEKLFSSILSSY